MRVLLVIVCLGPMLWGCAPPEATTSDQLPRAKVYVVGKEATGQSRRLSGRVVAADVSQLSFGVGGTISQVLVTAGDLVTVGQRLAELDQEPLRLAAEQARGQLAIARAKEHETRRIYDRSVGLLAKGASSQAEVDAAIADHDTARGNVRSAQSDVQRRERDLARVELVAPFAGAISARMAEPFQEVGASQEVLVLQSSDAFAVEVRVPETLVRLVDYGQVVEVSFPTASVSVAGVVSEIGAQAESGNAFPVRVQLAQNVDLLAGMTAAVTFNFDQYLSDGKTVYLLPISALAIDAGLVSRENLSQQASQTVPVYVVNDGGTLQLRQLTIGGVRGNELEVFEGLHAGDKVVSAGVPFLSEGMQVEIWDGELSDG